MLGKRLLTSGTVWELRDVLLIKSDRLIRRQIGLSPFVCCWLAAIDPSPSSQFESSGVRVPLPPLIPSSCPLLVIIRSAEHPRAVKACRAPSIRIFARKGLSFGNRKQIQKFLFLFDK